MLVLTPPSVPEYMYLPYAKKMIQFVSYLVAVHKTYNETVGNGDWFRFEQNNNNSNKKN